MGDCVLGLFCIDQSKIPFFGVRQMERNLELIVIKILLGPAPSSAAVSVVGFCYAITKKHLNSREICFSRKFPSSPSVLLTPHGLFLDIILDLSLSFPFFLPVHHIRWLSGKYLAM